MPKYKNVSGGSLELVVPGLEQRIVEDGEIVDIPAFQPDGESPIVVPVTDVGRPPRWEAVPDKPAAKSAGKAAE